MRQYIQTIAIQAAGPVMMAGLTFFLARQFGAVEQGLFYSAKASYDLIVACLVFGFPQSIILEINHRQASRSSIARLTFFYSLAVFVVLAFALVCWKPGFANSVTDALLVSSSASIIVAAYLWRAILITVDDGLRYSLVTTAPTLFFALACFVFVVFFANLSRHTNEIFLLSALGTTSATYLLAQPRKNFVQEGNRPSARKLVITGLDAFLLSLSATGQIYLTYAYLKEFATPSVMGYFSVAVATSNILAFPLQALSPVLLNRWSSRAEGQVAQSSRAPINLKLLMAIAIAGVGLIVNLTPYAIKFIAGDEFHGASLMIQLMVAYTAFTVVQRIANLKLTASGNIRFGSAVAIGRVALVALAFHVLAYNSEFKGKAGAAACIVWLVAEMLATGMTIFKVVALKGFGK